MASGAGIIRDRFLDLADSLNRVVRRFRIIGGKGQLLISLNSETRNLLIDFAEHSRITLDEAAIRSIQLPHLETRLARLSSGNVHLPGPRLEDDRRNGGRFGVQVRRVAVDPHRSQSGAKEMVGTDGLPALVR